MKSGALCTNKHGSSNARGRRHVTGAPNALVSGYCVLYDVMLRRYVGILVLFMLAFMLYVSHFELSLFFLVVDSAFDILAGDISR